ncbi:MAG: nucleotidyltransferase family protein [Bacteroidales bacterium]|nr:nucleotidyltransferase family protein [Bacteroidales bacterium]
MKEAIILAGGFGTRLRTVVSDVPKPMAPVAGRPFLSYLLDDLSRQGYRHVVLATGYLHEKVEACYGNEYGGMAVDYARELSPLGTGGAIVNGLQHCSEERITVLNGDTLFHVDHTPLLQADHAGCRLALLLRYVPDAGRYGAVETDGKGLVTAFREKDPTAGAGLINAGIYRMHRSLLDNYPAGQQFSFEKEVLQPLREPVHAYALDGYFIDIGVPDDYRRAQTELPLL